MFEGLASAVEPEQEESYVPGEPAFEMAIVNRIVEEWLAIPSRPWKPRIDATIVPDRDETKAYLRIIKRAATDSFDANLFLEGLTERFFSQDGCHKVSPHDLGYELDCIVQALFSLGHNNLAITLPKSEYFLDTGYMVGYNLRGTWRHPLVASYRAPLFSLAGCGVNYCRLEFDGEVRSGGGGGAKHSEVRFHGAAEKIGGPASWCSYYVQQSDSLHNVFLHSPVGCSYHVRNGISDSEKERLRMEEFPLWRNNLLFDVFGKKNRFYAPDGAGDWEEVRL